MAKPQWISSSDPFWSQYGNVNARDPESGEFTNPYISTIRGLQDVGNWQNVARQLGYQGPFETQVYATHEGGYDVVPAPEFLRFIQQKKAEGYDFVVKGDEVDKRTSTFGLKTPSGEVVGQRKATAAGFGEFFKEFVLPAVAAYGAVNFLGPRLEGLTNALSGGGQLSAADLANIPTGTMGQVSQPPALGAEGAGAMYTDVSMAPGTETGLFGEQFHPIKNYPYSDVTLNALAEPVASVATPAAAATDAANAMQLSPVTQLQPITLAGEPYLTAGAGGGASATAAGNVLAPAAAGGVVDNEMAKLLRQQAAVQAGTSALGGIGPGATALPSAIGAAGGSAALQALGGSLQAGATPGALGSAMGSTTAALAPAAAAVNAIAPAAAPAAGVMEGMVPGGLESVGIRPEALELMATGAVVAGAGAKPGLTGIPALDKAIDLVTSPAGQAVVGAVGSVAGGVMQANAAEAAANQQAEAARNALQLQREMFEYQKGLLEPYRTAGTAALKRLEGALGLGGTAQAQQMLEMDPGYGFRLGEGMKALERMQAARGNMLSGGALKAGQRYAQDYASGEYNNAYNRLANIAGLGQTVGGQLGSAAQQFGTSAGNVMGQEANALAAGRIGRGSAYSGAIQGGLNAFQNYFNRQQEEQLFRDIFGRTAVGG